MNLEKTNNADIVNSDNKTFSIDDLLTLISSIASVLLPQSKALAVVSGWSFYKWAQYSKAWANYREEINKWEELVVTLPKVTNALRELESLYYDESRKGDNNPVNTAMLWYNNNAKNRASIIEYMQALRKNIPAYINKLDNDWFLRHFPWSALFPWEKINDENKEKIQGLYDSLTDINLWLPNLLQAKQILSKNNISDIQIEKNKNNGTEYTQNDSFNNFSEEASDINIKWPQGLRDPFVSIFPNDGNEKECQDPDLSLNSSGNINTNNNIFNPDKSFVQQYSDIISGQVSLNAAIAAFNVSGITAPFLNISTSFEESDKKASFFGETLMNIADISGKIGGAFMNVDKNIGKAIGSAGGFAASISKIYSAVSADPLEGIDTTVMTPEQIEELKKQKEKQNGLAIMAGIQGAFAGLQGLFGGEAGSDTSELLGGLGGLGAGIAGLLTGNPLEGITSLISGIPSLFDGLFESTQEGYVKMLSRQGFNDTYSEDLLDKMSDVADRTGDKAAGISAYIEDFFAETNIDNEEEFSRMSDLLSGSIGEYIAQGHSNDEAYEKFGDELEQLVAAQEKYGFETTASLRDMIEIQKTQTREGRIEGMKSALGGFDKIISGIEKQMQLSPDFKLSGTSISGIAGSLTNTYYELINQGMAASEAVDTVKPLLSKYAGIAETQGWDLSQVPGYSQLSSYFDSLDKASGALDMIQGSTDVVKALSGSGMMDQATLTSQGSLGLDVMHQLDASGLNETQVLQQMGGWLQSMQQASEKWGLSLSPEIQALITKAEEKGVMPEEQKPVDEVIADGIETGFTRAIEVVDKYFGGLAEFGEGGTVPGAVGQKKLILAHAGEFVGFPEQLTALASDPAFASGGSDLVAFLQAMVQNMGMMAATMSVSEMSQMHMGEPSGVEYAQMLESKARENDRQLTEELQAQRAANAESNQLQLAQTIENNIKMKVSGRDFFAAIKQDIYDQIKEDSRRGMITIHDIAIKKY